jgi:hypothetical protein
MAALHTGEAVMLMLAKQGHRKPGYIQRSQGQV